MVWYCKTFLSNLITYKLKEKVDHCKLRCGLIETCGIWLRLTLLRITETTEDKTPGSPAYPRFPQRNTYANSISKGCDTESTGILCIRNKDGRRALC